MQQTVSLGTSSTELVTGNGCRTQLADVIQGRGTRCVIISDDQVESALRDKIPIPAQWLIVPSGEGSKSIEMASKLWSQLVEQGHDRASVIVAVGGGMALDLAGFVASTYMRGVPFYSLPTSLLGMVDASVGGKVGIDLPEGKNLVGQFYPAKMVGVDPELLATLPQSQWASGMAEVIKHGILQGGELWELLLTFAPGDCSNSQKVAELVELAVMVKVRVVIEDPYERTGLRATLNLGHTYGHAIEWCSDFDIGHGEAVALGLLAGLRLSRELGMLEQDFESTLTGLLRRWGLPTGLSSTQASWEWNSMKKAFGRDKKNKDGRWCFVLPRRVGEVETVWGPDEIKVQSAYDSLRGIEARS